MPVSFATAIRSERGPHRASNQDSVVCAPDHILVADGVGGNAGGDIASWTFTHRLVATLARRPTSTLDLPDIAELVAVANIDIARRAAADPALTGMATTFTGLFAGATTVRVGHIGDSRAYLVHAGQGRRVTRDDSLVQMLVDTGAVDPAAARTHPLRNVILHSLSGRTADAQDLTLLEVPATPGDRWLVTSDGLTDYVDEQRILATLAGTPDREEAADALLGAALAADSLDNISLAVVDVVDAEGAASDEPSVFLGAAADEGLGTVVDLA